MNTAAASAHLCRPGDDELVIETRTAWFTALTKTPSPAFGTARPKRCAAQASPLRPGLHRVLAGHRRPGERSGLSVPTQSQGGGRRSATCRGWRPRTTCSNGTARSTAATSTSTKQGVTQTSSVPARSKRGDLSSQGAARPDLHCGELRPVRGRGRHTTTPTSQSPSGSAGC